MLRGVEVNTREIEDGSTPDCGLWKALPVKNEECIKMHKAGRKEISRRLWIQSKNKSLKRLHRSELDQGQSYLRAT